MTSIKVLDNLNVEYEIIRKKTKTLRIRYDAYGKLIIIRPYGVPEDYMLSCVSKNIDWIIAHKPTKHLPHTTYVSGDEYLLLGKTYRLELLYNKHEQVIINEDKLYVYFNDLSHIGKLLNKYRLELAETVFNEILNNSFKKFNKYNIKYPKLEIKSYKSKWGCCYFNKNLIYINISLIHTPFELIEYVICHELTHFIVHDHSDEFHRVLEDIFPNEKECRKKLKNYSTKYE